ncbi:nucleoside hydrolase [Shinella sp.]|uniref:nucleoside hydrolase n=1 Tax=Shinella sp. TaxID=1870904 RepID=UPI00258E6B3C|nr:nucleoside hydrolase [Shinella sp.]MCW5710668.1 nucleoside hydrolase [Shinella sp.]
MARPIIIDTDPGIDDVLAITLACASPEVDVIGITTVGGNTGIANTTENALRWLNLVGRNDIPVAAGAHVPLVRWDTRPDATTHGTDGLGGLHLAEAPRSADTRNANELLIDLIEGSAEPVTLVAIGPLTNVATLHASAPKTFAKLERIVIMGGGARVLGNITPAAEFNIWYDPEAAARVFAAAVPITMVGLDVTHKALTPPDAWEPLRSGGELGRSIGAMIDFYAKYHLEHFGVEASAQHDALAVAAMLWPDIVDTSSLFVDVECSGTLTRGLTLVDIDNIWRRPPNADVALEVDADAFQARFIERLVSLDAMLQAKSGPTTDC